MKVQEIAYHRNGVSGEPFYVVAFRSEGVDMIGVVFDFEEADAYEPRVPMNPRTAVFDRYLIGEGVIAFAENSWRGDRYDRALREAIAEHERAQAEQDESANRNARLLAMQSGTWSE